MWICEWHSTCGRNPLMVRISFLMFGLSTLKSTNFRFLVQTPPPHPPRTKLLMCTPLAFWSGLVAPRFLNIVNGGRGWGHQSSLKLSTFEGGSFCLTIWFSFSIIGISVFLFYDPVWSPPYRLNFVNGRTGGTKAIWSWWGGGEHFCSTNVFLPFSSSLVLFDPAWSPHTVSTL